MNDRSGLLTLAVYITATMLIVLAAFWGVYHYGAVARVSALGPPPNDPVPELAVTGLQVSGDTMASQGSVGDLEQNRIRLLESLLAERNAYVRQMADQIVQQETELAALEERYENALLALTTLPTAPAAEWTEEQAESDAETPGPSRDQLEAELMLTRAVHDTLLADLDAVQQNLDNAAGQIVQLQDELNQTTANRLQDILALETASASALLPLGREAVPALIGALTHVNPVVRRWAASVLGSIGQDAGDAAGALAEALSDPDPSVRRAAKTALDAIER